MEDWIQSPIKSHLGGSIIWKAVVKSIGIIESCFAMKVDNGRKIRINEDPWVGGNIHYWLLAPTVNLLHDIGVCFLAQLAAPIQANRWSQN